MPPGVGVEYRYPAVGRALGGSERDLKNVHCRAEARYLLALVRKNGGRTDEAKAITAEALAERPDLLPARLELRGDVIDALPK